VAAVYKPDSGGHSKASDSRPITSQPKLNLALFVYSSSKQSDLEPLYIRAPAIPLCLDLLQFLSFPFIIPKDLFLSIQYSLRRLPLLPIHLTLPFTYLVDVSALTLHH